MDFSGPANMQAEAGRRRDQNSTHPQAQGTSSSFVLHRRVDITSRMLYIFVGLLCHFVLGPFLVCLFS